MFVIIGWIVLLGCVFGGFAVHGDIDTFLQPFKFVIILVAGLGTFIVAYQMPVVCAQYLVFRISLRYFFYNYHLLNPNHMYKQLGSY